MRKISQAFIIQDNKVLMVKQYTSRGKIVWTFPGGGLEEGETFEQGVIREVKEETGYDVSVNRLLRQEVNRYQLFLCDIDGGYLRIDKSNPDNDDIIDVRWVDINDPECFDEINLIGLNSYKRSL
jgi:8-oxo-dGTP diphosphatase